MLGRGDPPGTLRACDVATQAPRTIRPDELAARALEMMEGRITSLIVAGEDGAIVGVVHLHDILRAKIV
jgi:arabinose-5-phosphate isomerase